MSSTVGTLKPWKKEGGKPSIYLICICCCFEPMVLSETWKLTYQVKWVCVHCIIAVSQFDYLKSKLGLNSRLPITKLYGHHCSYKSPCYNLHLTTPK